MAGLVNYFVRRVLVEGNSMAPTYQSGERVTALRRWRPVHSGDVVVLRDPRVATRWMIKRCVAKVGTHLDLRGDNADESTDSREFGLVASHDVTYIVLAAKPPIEAT